MSQLSDLMQLGDQLGHVRRLRLETLEDSSVSTLGLVANACSVGRTGIHSGIFKKQAPVSWLLSSCGIGDIWCQ